MQIPPHSSDCFRNYLVLLDRDNMRAFAQISRRERWDCPACAAKKIGKVTEHLVARSETLCWGPYSKAKVLNAQRKRIGYLSIGFVDDVRMLVAASHLYEPAKPSLQVIEELVEHTTTRQVSRLGWSDNWRPPPSKDPNRWDVVDSKCDDLARVNAAIERAGCVDGKIVGKSTIEVKAIIEQILNGVSFNSGK